MSTDDIVDLRPYIRRKQQLTCSHQHTEVGHEGDASLTCGDCGAEIDPWWFIRRLSDWETRLKERHREYTVAYEAKVKEGEALVAKLNAMISRLNDEIGHPYDVKNRLSNESINGQRLGAAAARRRRPRSK